MAVDVPWNAMTAEQMRKGIKAAADTAPCNVRIEGCVNWLHIDVLPQEHSVYEFRA